MTAIKISLDERETVIRKSDAEDKWTVYTESPPLMRKLSKFMAPVEDRGYAKIFLVPAEMLVFRKKRTVSEERRAALRERMKERRQRVHGASQNAFCEENRLPIPMILEHNTARKGKTTQAGIAGAKA